MPATLLSVSSLAQQSAAPSCDAPAGVTGGMLLIAFQAAGTLTAMTTPTGGTTWNLLGQQDWTNDATFGTKVWWKIAGGSEPAAYGFATSSSTTRAVIAIAAITGAATTAPLMVSSNSAAQVSTLPTPSITPTAEDDLDLRWLASNNSAGQPITFTPPATYTEQMDLQSGNFLAATLATKQLNSSSATGIQNFTGSRTSLIHMGISIAVTKTLFIAPRPTVIGQAVQRAANW